MIQPDTQESVSSIHKTPSALLEAGPGLRSPLCSEVIVPSVGHPIESVSTAAAAPTMVTTAATEPSSATESPVAGSPVAESSVAGSPVTESSAAASPVTESLAAESSAAASPVTESPVTESPVIKAAFGPGPFYDPDALYPK